MNSPITGLLLDFPDLRAAQIASALAKSPQSIRQQLRYSLPTGKTTVNGQTADTWHQSALPAALRSRLAGAARAGGFNTVGELIRARMGAWSPAVPLSECEDECLSEAAKLRQALLPSLRRFKLAATMADLVNEGLDEFETVFGHRISSRYFYALISRTVERDGGQGNYERLELYLPARPARRPAAPDFPAIADAINECGTLETIKGNRVVQVDREEIIWKKTCETRKTLIESGQVARRVDRQLCTFLLERAPSLAPSRKALRKKYARRVEAFAAGKSFDGRGDNGPEMGELARQILALPWFVPAARFFYLLSNKTSDSGSVPAAVLYTINLPKVPVAWIGSQEKKLLKALALENLPVCPPELRQEILRRRNAYQKLVPASIHRQIKVNSSLVQFHRSPREWSLGNLSAPGSQRRYYNHETNQRELMRPGDWFGGDDATPGIAVCVPCTDLTTPTSKKFGVMLGRFQWLVYSDCASDKILGWDYIVRPRGSYRAEDILNGMGAAMKPNGVPRQGWQFEGGTFNSKLVRHTIENLGCQHWRTYSPHQKPIENVFNRAWTKLAVQFPHADMGRYRNENEANCKLYEACKGGHQDPRRYFPPLKLFLAGLGEEVNAHNAKPIQSNQYGRWVPDDFFAAEVAKNPLRAFSSDMEWTLSPYAEERTVRGYMVTCRFPLFEGFRVPFEFGADWLPAYSGRKVRIHFNPRQPRCSAKVVLLENCGDHRAGEILGDAPLISETAGHIRYLLDWASDDQRAGFVAKQKAANFVRRETRGIGAGGRVEYSRSEERDGVGKVNILQRGRGAGAIKETDVERSGNRLAQSLAEPTKTRAQRQAELAVLRAETGNLFC
jgi:hypothetical protein